MAEGFENEEVARLARTAKRFMTGIGLYILTPWPPSDLERFLGGSGFYRHKQEIDERQTLTVTTYRHEDYRRLMDGPAMPSGEAEDAAANFPLHDAELAHFMPSLLNTADNAVLILKMVGGLEECIAESALKPVLDVGRTGFWAWFIPVTLEYKSVMRFSGTEEYPALKADADAKNQLNLQIGEMLLGLGQEPEFELVKSVLTKLRSETVPFYALGSNEQRYVLLCENNPAAGGFVAHPLGDIETAYRLLVEAVAGK